MKCAMRCHWELSHGVKAVRGVKQRHPPTADQDRDGWGWPSVHGAVLN
jgi:hypothetical protein